MMAVPIEAQLILCDAAQAEPGSGKIHMLGAGWSVTGSPTAHAVAVLIKIPWDRSNEKLPIKLSLLDADGHPVELPTPTGATRIENAGVIEAGRPPGITPGTPLDASFAVTVPQLPLRPGRYQWRLELAETTQSRSFTVRG